MKKKMVLLIAVTVIISIATGCGSEKGDSSIASVPTNNSKSVDTESSVDMKKLEEDGIELSLDDYGSGNSNISYILSLPFKMIKIDKGIIWKSFENPRADIALKETINMMKALGMKIVAEGVETKTQVEILKRYGCDIAQGYHFDRPLPKDEFEKRLDGIGIRK